MASCPPEPTGLPLAGRGGMAGGRTAAPGVFVGAGGRGMVSLAGAGRMGGRGGVGQGYGPAAGMAGGRAGGFAGPPRAMMPQNAGRQLPTALPLHLGCTATPDMAHHAVCTRHREHRVSPCTGAAAHACSF